MKNETTKTTIFGDTIYTLSDAYIRGVLDARKKVCYGENPYDFEFSDQFEQEVYDWNDGHCNEWTIIVNEALPEEMNNHKSII